MTAPQTPRNQPPERSYDPWSAPAVDEENAPVSGEPNGAPADARPRDDLGHDLREAAVIAFLVAASGVLLGVLWAWLAPHIPLFRQGKDIYLKNTEGEEAIGADGTFVLLALGLGVLSATVVFLVRRRGGIPLVVALAAGGLLASVVAWRTGLWLGPSEDVGARALKAGEGVPFDGPLRLQAKGALLAWPLAAMLTQLALTGLFGPRDPDPYRDPMVPDWSGGHQQHPTPQQHPEHSQPPPSSSTD
ncbi:DUF2567 domain-containing protein [Streptomyces sp. MST-110588]|uniref:DUF2567 domain-containing protein n=1 Tax=Streptomyces sp. MST-110588 TaxID=2833628 RepID=UPI001F5D1D94|nr:DUF2567 domain-containing protein [Streptomyces sp. MST-110588]UNO42608.1 ABC transporter permease [Streptomyces sp. MST-110588]